MSPPLLNKIHLQRLRVAADAAKSGAEIRFRVDPTDPPVLVWVLGHNPSVRHAILNAPSAQMPAWRKLAEDEFRSLTAPPVPEKRHRASRRSPASGSRDSEC